MTATLPQGTTTDRQDATTTGALDRTDAADASAPSDASFSTDGSAVDRNLGWRPSPCSSTPTCSSPA